VITIEIKETPPLPALPAQALPGFIPYMPRLAPVIEHAKAEPRRSEAPLQHWLSRALAYTAINFVGVGLIILLGAWMMREILTAAGV
jgi:hypothetical protein